MPRRLTVPMKIYKVNNLTPAKYTEWNHTTNTTTTTTTTKKQQNNQNQQSVVIDISQYQCYQFPNKKTQANRTDVKL